MNRNKFYNKCWSLPLLAVMVLFFYQIYIGEFIVLKKKWHDEGLYLTLGFMGSILLFFYLSTKTANPVEQYRSKVRSRLRSPYKSIILKYLGYPFMLLLVFSMSYMSLVETIPTLYTSQFGKPYSSSITILNKDDIRYGGKICPGRYKVNSPEFQHNSWLNVFCIHRDSKDLLPFPGIINVRGHQTYFGRTIEEFDIETTKYSNDEFKKLRNDIYNYWNTP